MKIAIIHKEKCKPEHCGHVCMKACPINKKGDECIKIEGKALIDEKLCIGCSICQKRCPFGAIDIINIPSIEDQRLIYRYGSNGFALYGLPIPRENTILGLLGRNGIGKSTAIEILSGKKKINFGLSSLNDCGASGEEIRKYLQGTELLKYFDSLEGKKISYKPQNLSFLFVDVKAIELLKQRGSEEEIRKIAEKLGVEKMLDSKLDKLSGGELQKIAIIAAAVSESDIYFFDEPLAFLDIAERIRVSDFIRELARGKNVIVVEHDLLMLDYLAEYLNIFYGQSGCFGLISGIKSTRYGINSYLGGFLKEENLRIRDKELSFNFTKNKFLFGRKIAEWPNFTKELGKFKLKVSAGSIHENHVVGIVGKNGTGKTTFVKCLAGLEEVEIDGKKNKLDVKLDISYKPQYLFNDFEETVMEIMRREKIDKKMASMFNLENLHLKKIKQLSGGESQRFAIARCLAKEADIYLIDEPSAYLDVEERISVAKAIKKMMVEKSKTAFVVDHDLLLVSYLADSILVFSGDSGLRGASSEVLEFEEGIGNLLKELDITLRKDKESGRPKINDKGSVLDREQRAKGIWAEF